jgi:hypothetical protein
MPDPTYVRDEIKQNPEWHLAYSLSEILNDDAPIGWYKYVFVAKCLLANYNITPKESR